LSAEGMVASFRKPSLPPKLANETSAQAKFVPGSTVGTWRIWNRSASSVIARRGLAGWQVTLPRKSRIRPGIQSTTCNARAH